MGWTGWWRAGVQVTGHLKRHRKAEKLCGRQLEAERAVCTVPGRSGACMTAARKQQQPFKTTEILLRDPVNPRVLFRDLQMMARKSQLMCHTAIYVKFLKGNLCSTGISIRTNTPNQTGKQCGQSTAFPFCFLLRLSAQTSLCLPSPVI